MSGSLTCVACGAELPAGGAASCPRCSIVGAPPVARIRRRKRGTPRWVWAVAGGVGLTVLAAGAGGTVLLARWTTTFDPVAPPGWTAVRDNNGGFSVFLPGYAGPVLFTGSDGQPDPTRSGYVGTQGEPPEWLLVRATSVQMPDQYTPAGTPEQLFAELYQFDYTLGGLEVTGRTPVTIGGRPGLEVRFNEKPFLFGKEGFAEHDRDERARVEREGRRAVRYITSRGRRVFILSADAHVSSPDEAMLKTIVGSFSFL